MAQTQDSKTDFMSLPVEVRTQIYGYVLHREDAVHIAVIRRKTPTLHLELARQGHNRDKNRRGVVYDWQTRAWVPTPPTYLSILFMNRQIYKETVGVLYGTTTFKLTNARGLTDFLKALGTRARDLRHIEIASEGYSKSTMRFALSSLSSTANSLRTLKLDHYDICDAIMFTDEKLHPQIFKDLLSFLKTLRRSYEKQNLNFDIMRVLEIGLSGGDHRACNLGPATNDPSHRHHCVCDCTTIFKNHQLLVEGVRGIMADGLGILEKGGQND